MWLERILGPPGTGKTTALMERLDELITEGYSLASIAFITFSRAGIHEVIERVKERFDPPSKYSLDGFATFNSLTYKLLGWNRHNILGRSAIASFFESRALDYYKGVYDVVDNVIAFQDSLNWEPGNIAHNFITTLKNAYLVDVRDLTRKHFEELWTQYLGQHGHRFSIVDFNHVDLYNIARDFENMKDSTMSYDYVDSLYLTWKHNIDIPQRVLFVDEFQDLSPLQYALYCLWKPNRDRVFIAGDPDQTIYSFNYANPKFFISEKPDKDTTLTISYRLPLNILNVCKDLISRNTVRLNSDYTTNIRGGVVQVLDFTDSLLPPNPDGKTFVLFRTNFLKRQCIENLLIPNGVPFGVIGSQSQWTPRLVNIANGLLEFREWRRTLRDPQVGACLATLALALPSNPFIRHGAKSKLRQNRQLRASNVFTPHARTTPFDTLINHLDISEAQQLALHNYLNSPHARQIDRLRLQVGTIHSSKGMEAANVFVCTDIPRRVINSPDLEGETRLLYVACSRARDHLILFHGFARTPFTYQDKLGWAPTSTHQNTTTNSSP